GQRKSAPAQFNPIIKIDASDGKVTRCDRIQKNGEWTTEPHIIPYEDFEAIFDMPDLKVGWLCFTPPDFKLVPVGKDYGDSPSDKDKEGFRLRVLLRNGAGNTVHELSSTAIALWDSMNDLHGEWEKSHSKQKGKLPVIGITEMIRKTTANGTSYRP